MQSDPRLVFDPWKLIHFSNLLMEPHWNPSGILLEMNHQGLKIKTLKEKIVKIQNLEGY